MSTQAKEAKSSLIKEAIEAAENVVEIGLDVDRLKKKASETVEDGVAEAKRMIKRGRYAAEDLVEDTAHRIKHDPWRSVGITFAAGVGLGVLIGWLVGREKTERSD
jgi:ElaB/YqjD/DUF883 family membrane-anchored ribosome-binding protein